MLMLLGLVWLLEPKGIKSGHTRGCGGLETFPPLRLNSDPDENTDLPVETPTLIV